MNINLSFLKLQLLSFFLFAILISSSQAAEITVSNLQGKIQDKTTTEVLPYASIVITSLTDSLYVIGVISDLEGNYSFEAIPYGRYTLSASYMGYEKLSIVLKLDSRKQKLDLFLTKKSFAFSEVEVSGEKEMIVQTIGKKTVNISKNNTLSGGNALDVMQSLSSVDMDMNGQIRYRGSSRVTILIDGKQSELTKNLEQISADQIEKIEIINNPSAKYEADGMSGIINIVMKSADNDLSGRSLSLYYGSPETYGSNVGYFEKHKKTRYFFNTSINRKTQFQTKEHWRYNYENGNALDYYQYDRQNKTLFNFMINAGLDYKINSKQQIGISLLGSEKLNNADRSINYQSWNKEGVTLNDSYKDIEISLHNYVFDGNLDYQFQLNKSQKLDAILHYNYLDQSQNMEFNSYEVGSSHPRDHEYQNTYSDQLNQTADFSLDYSWNISDSSLLQSGYKYSREDLLNDFRSKTIDFNIEDWVWDTELANEFHYIKSINALYINYESKFKYFNLQLGLRGEHTTSNQFVKAKESYFDVFPSVRLSKRLDQYFRLYISSNRRINRPILKMINPYTNEYADILNMHIGNPDLKPEYVNSFEAGSLYSSDKTSGSFSVYYRHIDQAISRVKSSTNDSALLVTFMNLDQAQLFGGELSFSTKAFKWWEINTNANVFYTTLVGAYGPNRINKSHTGWTGSLKNQFKLPWKLQMQFSFYYKSPLPDVLGTYMERYYADMAISRKILKNKGKIVFKISDVFNTYRFGLDLEGLDDVGYHYSQINRRKNESQYFILSFVYNFKAKEKKKKENFYLEGFGK